MIGRVPRHRSAADDADPGAAHVFIPGALATGFLVSLALLVGDAVRRVRGDRATSRRAEVTASALLAHVRGGPQAVRHVGGGSRTTALYGVLGSASVGLAMAVGVGATWNYLNPDGYMRALAWPWTVSLLGALGFAWLGVQSLRLAPAWIGPGAFAVAGGFSARFAVLAERPWRVGAIGLVLTVAVTWLAARVAPRRPLVTASVQALLARTPLGSAVQTRAADAAAPGEHEHLPGPGRTQS